MKSVKFELNGLDEYLKKIKEVGNNVDEAVKEALTESAKPIYEDIKSWAEKHKRTGEMLEGVNMSEVQQDGNNFYVEVGLDTDKSKNAWHGVFVEYGTPTQAADPGIRTAYSSNKNKIKKIQKDILEKAGVPIE